MVRRYEILVERVSCRQSQGFWRGSGVAGNCWILAVFAGKDASRALAQSSLKIEDCRPEYEDLEDKDKKVLDDWFTFFSKRYNIVGKVQC